MKKLLFALSMVTVMLLSGINTIEVSAKEHEPKTTEVKEAKTKKKVKKSKKTAKEKAEEKFKNMIIDYLEDKYDVCIKDVDIQYRNRKKTKAEFAAINEDETIMYFGNVELTKKLGFDSVDWSVAEIHA